jgi:ATP-binding cassette subfamily B (MDR/TAP) protein 1
MDTVMRVKEGRTTVVITHKLAVMEQCDRLLAIRSTSKLGDGSPERSQTISTRAREEE